MNVQTEVFFSPAPWLVGIVIAVVGGSVCGAAIGSLAWGIAIAEAFLIVHAIIGLLVCKR